jgi:hypothetical protein
MPWIIDRDYISSGEDRVPSKKGTNAFAVGVCSRSWLKLTSEQRKKATARFRMLDDDGNVYYGGRCTADVEFQPLDDFGMPNAGCTTIQFRENGEWRTL